MASLDDIIAEVVRRGRFSLLTLASTSDGRFQAGFRDTVSSGYRIETDKDPVAALQRVLHGAAGRRAPRTSKPDPYTDLI